MKKIRTIFLWIISLWITFYLLGFMIFTLIHDNKDSENSEKLEVSDMIYWDIIQEPQVVEAPKEDVRFPDSNPIYWWTWTHEIVWDKTIYYNDEYGISLRVREDFSWGMVQELNTREALYEHEYLAHYISFSIINDDIPEMYKIDWKWYEQNFLIVAYDNEEIEKWNLNSRFWNPEYYEILWKNNKYTFIITPKNKNYTDLYIFDVKESGDNQFLEDIKSSWEQPQWKNILITTEDEMDMNINLQIWNKTFDVVLEDNIATKALLEKLKGWEVVVKANEYWWFEKVGNLGFDLPRADKQITTEPGDLVLYQWNQISLFYNSNSWSYTKLWKVQNISKSDLWDWDVTLTFSLK